MYMDRISELTTYLSKPNRSNADLCRFVTLNTLQKCQPNSLFLGELGEHGEINVIGSFGIDQINLLPLGQVDTSQKYPLVDAFRQNSCVKVTGAKEIIQTYPLLSAANLPSSAKTVLAWPLTPVEVGKFGAVVILEKDVEITPEVSSFLFAIGGILSLHLIRLATDFEREEIKSEKKNRSDQLRLSERENVIIEKIILGMSNSQIARDLGFSESLIRQETVKIYQILNVAGRKELIRNSLEFHS